MEHSTFVILEIISSIAVCILSVVFVALKVIEQKHDLEDMYNEPASWWSAIAITLAPLWCVLLAIIVIVISILAACGFIDFIMYLRN